MFLHYKPKIETSERFEKVWIGDMNAAAASGHEDERCFQVLLNTVMADISGQVTRRPAQRNGVSSGAAPSERRLQSGAATCSEGFVCKMLSEISPCLLGQRGGCSTTKRPVELSENILRVADRNIDMDRGVRGKHKDEAAEAADGAAEATAAVSCQRCLTAEAPPVARSRTPRGDANHRQRQQSEGSEGSDEPCEVCRKLRTLSGMVAAPRHGEGRGEVSRTGHTYAHAHSPFLLHSIRVYCRR